MPSQARKLEAEAIRRVCPPEHFDFGTTRELPSLTGVLGQPRAVAALEFGAAIASHGFNLFALGQTGSGRTTLIREFLGRRAAAQPTPDDLCFVFNFADSRRPLPLRLPAGRGAAFRDDVKALVAELQTAIPQAFDASAYTEQRDQIVNDLESRRQDELRRLDQRITQAGFRLLKGPSGLAILPFRNDKVIPEEELEKLGAEERDRVKRVRERLQKETEDCLRRVRDVEKQARASLHTLDTESASFAIDHLIEERRQRYQDVPSVVDYLKGFAADVLENLDDFRRPKEGEAPPPALAMLMPVERPFVRYMVNLLVDNRGLQGAPVVVETNPTYHNLTGRIEHHTTMGGAFTDHTLIKAGALHHANGGYLILPARECLMNPYAWEVLKRSLQYRAIDVEELGSQLSLISTVTLDPEPVPLDVKVVLIGSPALYYLLSAHDEDFAKLFKVKAEFASHMDRTREAEREYALFVNAISSAEGTLPFDRGAVARVVEYGSRTAGDQDRLSTRFGDVADLIREAAHRASGNAHQAVTAEDVRAAEAARLFRQNLIEETVLDSLRKETVLIETTGSAVGRINGLSVVGLPDYAFGHPVRLTAAVGPGRRGVISIEREVELSGPIHGKGVLILGGYLTRQYGTDRPLNLSASLVFEQSYGMVEGDSASLAELCTLISALSGVPLRQDLAVTGSINQHGAVQAVGGVTEKVEGFFRACASRGLTGQQGVLLPVSNQRHLMLSDEVVEAVRGGRFHIWTAATVDEALELLTGESAGQVTGDGSYPEGSIHWLTVRTLEGYARAVKGEDRKPE
jgi:lon-related putative ATP-dependent protease